MHVIKVGVSLFIFVLVVISGWVIDTHIREQQASQIIWPSTLQSYIIYSSHSPATSIDHNTPYEPREYVRIIRQISH